MSMFRKPGEDSSSSSEASFGQIDDDETSASQQDSVLSRINTLDSAASGGPAVMQSPPRLEMRQNSAQNVRDLMLHALLEEQTLTQVAEQLGKGRSDPEVQRLGREAYQAIAQQISNNVDNTYAGDEMQAHRAAANAGITKLTKNNLSRLSVIPEGTSQALVTRPPNSVAMEIPQQPSVGFDILSGIPAPTELHLRGFPGLQTDRYVREFAELEIVGKGGYGKVFKAKHKLDGSFYAVKRIPVSPAKLAKIQEHGPQELESMLEEVRSLARFEHTNVVRYHNAWLEFTTAPTEVPSAPTVTILRDDRLLEGAAAFSSSPPITTHNLPSTFGKLAFDDSLGRSDHDHSADIVFETSENGMGAEESKSETGNLSLKEKLRRSRRKNRRGSQASQATIATISSTKSRMSAVEDVDEVEDDEVEIIPRTHMPYFQESTSEFSESMVSHSDIPDHLIPSRSPGPVLTLNVQMSLCETNLAAFLSSDRSSSVLPSLDRHCFHPCVSLELLGEIVSGVEYLHAQGVVHRDLKPANVFLSLSTARRPPHGSVDVSSCRPCPKRDCLHVTPRIGDFGLVAALGDTCTGAQSSTKPVGTEFYRPHSNNGISEKLDVFALGVVGFEMLQNFGTRMERIAALTDLRQGKFPDSFAHDYGDAGSGVQKLLSDMVQMDEQQRINCDEVKNAIVELVQLLKV